MACAGCRWPTSRENLQRAISLARASRAKVLLVGMMIPPNYGQRYAQEFRDMFTALSKNNEIPFTRPLPAGRSRAQVRVHAGRRHPCQRQGTAPPARQRLAPAQAVASCPRQTRGLAFGKEKRGLRGKALAQVVSPRRSCGDQCQRISLAQGDDRARARPCTPCAMPM